ncbi:Phosphoenolpyruvate/pyruvate domain-containing protein, partial [Rhizoclosmatium globosum]
MFAPRFAVASQRLIPRVSTGVSFRFYSSLHLHQLSRKKVTIPTLKKLHASNTPITVMTAHDYPSGVFCEKAKWICTTKITMDEMLHHCRLAEWAIENCVRMAVKIEGGVEMAETVAKVVRVGIPVLGHVGLTPQRATTKDLLADALALQKAGCFAMVLESVPNPVAQFITEQLNIPTIGIVLVQMDMIGIYDKFTPKFCKL